MPELDYFNDSTSYKPAPAEKYEPVSLVSITSDAGKMAANAAVKACDPFWDLQVPGNHPLRGLLYNDRMMNNDVLDGVTRLGDNRVTVRAVTEVNGEKQKMALDVARLPGGEYFVRDHVANRTTLYTADNTKVVMEGNGTAFISGPNGVKQVKDSFMLKSKDGGMIKVNPQTGGVFHFGKDGDITNLRAPEYWAPPRPLDAKKMV